MAQAMSGVDEGPRDGAVAKLKRKYKHKYFLLFFNFLDETGALVYRPLVWQYRQTQLLFPCLIFEAILTTQKYFVWQFGSNSTQVAFSPHALVAATAPAVQSPPWTVASIAMSNSTSEPSPLIISHGVVRWYLSKGLDMKIHNNRHAPSYNVQHQFAVRRKTEIIFSTRYTPIKIATRRISAQPPRYPHGYQQTNSTQSAPDRYPPLSRFPIRYSRP